MSEWTEFDDKKLEQMCLNGESASFCARFFNESQLYRIGYQTSRNACIGRANRLGLKFGSHPGCKKQVPSNGWTTKEDCILKKMCAAGESPFQAAAKLQRTMAACRMRAASLGVSFTDHIHLEVTASDNKIYEHHEVSPDQRPVPIEELTGRSCRWPLEENGVHVGYCGAKKDGMSYCKFHAELAYPALATLAQGKKQRVA